MRFFLFFLLTFSTVFAGERIFLDPGTPLFRGPEITASPVAIVPDPGMAVEKIGEQVYHIHRNALAHRLILEKYRLNPQTVVWGTRMMGTELDNGRFVRYFPLKSPLRMALGTVLVLASLICGCYWFRNRRNFYLPVLTLLLLQWGIVTYVSGAVPTYFLHPVDEAQYFRTALDLSQGRIAGIQWSYTIGLPLLYVPFIWLTGAQSYYDIEIPYVIFNAWILGPMCLVLLYFILRKLTGCGVKAFFATLLFPLMAVFYQYQDHWEQKIEDWGMNIYKSYFAFPTLDFSYNLYTKYTVLHYNALSDTLSTLAVLGCIALLLYWKNGWRKLILLSLLFGYACIVRLNNIFFAPLLLFLLFWNFRDRLRDWRYLLRFAGTGAVCYLAVVSMQLLVNRIQFGDFFRFPYYLHPEEVYAGFKRSMFPYGIHFILSVKYAYFALGLTGLCLIRDRYRRTVLGLWILPTLFFFAGYPQLGNNVSRFLLTILMVLPGCVFCTEVFDNTPLRERIAAVFAVLLPLAVAAPSNYAFPKLLQWDFQRFENGFLIVNILTVLAALASCALILIFLRKKRMELLFSVLFLVLFLSGSWHLLFAVCVFLSGRIIYDLIQMRNAYFFTENLPTERSRS